MRQLFLTYVALCGLTATATAADVLAIADPALVSFEGGLRYWYSTGEASKDLYDSSGTLRVSRLTYDRLDAHSGEVFFNATHNPTGIFVKGLLGAGGIAEGSLVDEDFLPYTNPYSNTSSDHRGDITYFITDLGYYFWNTPRRRIGAFVGYNFWNERYNAAGCAQQATNPWICAPAIPTNVGIISQDNDWHSLRLGLAGQTQLTERLSLSGDVAFLFTRLDGKDRHLLRPKINPMPENGDGHGVQLEAVLNYKVTDLFNIGVGARYWRVAADGTAHFDETPGGGIPQVEDWQAERYGMFVQANIKFN
ncbi:omptin family outer membrane protease [Mesorhizobium sp. YC-39]|uniref:Outer membrane protease n=1 Tax=Mesorhizobium robiniae TaxID=559315 RepID=A0ABV2GZF2_9HYPH|nr:MULTISPECIES: omptin family outer membrane protease [unclassified Mesorhizobium]MCV3211464.1 omptin family outer membrane protease [Mesorhizobium sp. YC-2]MCV3233180.1 omptin family outer membrane protease [Mesorhizobium sp. YC-39]MCV3242124.1 omptin family outer membrane protease [Mesorhizobium sp. ZC-5]